MFRPYLGYKVKPYHPPSPHPIVDIKKLYMYLLVQIRNLKENEKKIVNLKKKNRRKTPPLGSRSPTPFLKIIPGREIKGKKEKIVKKNRRKFSERKKKKKMIFLIFFCLFCFYEEGKTKKERRKI